MKFDKNPVIISMDWYETAVTPVERTGVTAVLC